MGRTSRPTRHVALISRPDLRADGEVIGALCKGLPFQLQLVGVEGRSVRARTAERRRRPSTDRMPPATAALLLPPAGPLPLLDYLGAQIAASRHREGRDGGKVRLVCPRHKARLCTREWKSKGAFLRGLFFFVFAKEKVIRARGMSTQRENATTVSSTPVGGLPKGPLRSSRRPPARAHVGTAPRFRTSSPTLTNAHS